MFRRRVLMSLAVSVGLLAVGALPAQAEANLVKKKSVTGPHGRLGTAAWYQEKKDGKVSNSVRFTADDNDGPGGKCTETWVDYSTKPHKHWNPGVFVNCDGGTRSFTGMTNNGETIRGFGLIVCEVPDTSGPITRNSSNCRGDMGSMYLHSGQRYSSFDVTADSMPSGIQVYGV